MRHTTLLCVTATFLIITAPFQSMALTLAPLSTPGPLEKELWPLPTDPMPSLPPGVVFDISDADYGPRAPLILEKVALAPVPVLIGGIIAGGAAGLGVGIIVGGAARP